MNYKVILDKMEELFINLGFSPVIINGVRFMRYKECYCKMTFMKEWSAFVIESADNIQTRLNYATCFKRIYIVCCYTGLWSDIATLISIIDTRTDSSSCVPDKRCLF